MSGRNGPAAADPFSLLYQQAFGELVGYLHGLVGDRAAAEDLAQDAGVRILRMDAAQRDALNNPRAFLFHVATNLARDHLRKRMVRDAADSDLPQEGHSPGADVVEQSREDLARVAQGIAQLPNRSREVLLLSRVRGYSHTEIGERLGIAAKTVENHLARALKDLAARLGRG
ncbi:MAG: RNA polymerase sigma factor [Xanthomonadales bacterium]|nr:RNA polymerase sigma factor [Xanthomonadales bacterium]